VNPQLQLILEQVRGRAAAYFPDLGKEVDIRVVGARRRPYSEIFHIALGNGRQSKHQLVIKVFPKAPAQFRHLQAIWPHFADHASWKVPRPLDCFDTGPALVLEAVPGDPVDRRLPQVLWRGQRLREAEADCRRAGQWLRFYHDVGGREEVRVFDVRDKWNGLEESLQGLRVLGFSPGVCSSLLDVLRPLLKRLGSRPWVVSHVHGGFLADNVLIHHGTVTALDCSVIARNLIEHDIASFLNSLSGLRLTRPVPWSAVRRLEDVFLEGYFGEGGHDEATLTFLRGTGLADTALEILGRRPSHIARMWVQHFFAGTVRTLRLPRQGSGVEP
jgi:hypothetical protein